MAQVLRDAGYRTLMTGKWHLGVPEEFSPAARGFDQSYVLVHGGSSHWSDQAGIVAVDPAKPPKAIYRENGKAVDVPKDFFSSAFFGTIFTLPQQPQPQSLSGAKSFLIRPAMPSFRFLLVSSVMVLHSIVSTLFETVWAPPPIKVLVSK